MNEPRIRKPPHFFACRGTVKQHGILAAMCAGSSRDTANVVRRKSQLLWVQDVYPDEHQRHLRDLLRQGVEIVGHFPTAREAYAALGISPAADQSDHGRTQ
jgi:hypothetical protein